MRPYVFSAALLALTAGGCTDQGSGVLISVGATGMINVTTLHLEATAEGSTRTYDIAAPHPTIPPAATILLEVPRSISGTMALALEARDGAGTVIAKTNTTTTIVTGQLVELTMTFGTAGTDLAGIDFYGADLNGVDFAVAPPDEAMPDLVNADLVVVPPDMCPATFTMVPTSHDFLTHNAGDNVAGFDVKMQNNGCSTTGIIAAATLGGTDAAQFAIDTDGCKDFSYAVGAAACTVTVSFHPTGAGARTATLNISDGVRTGTATLTGKSLGAAGATCSGDGDCQSTHCTDGVCCDKDATQCKDCYACNVASKEGTCSPVPVDTDPKSACTAAVCSTNKCDGAGACAPGKSGQVCQDDGCVGSGLVKHYCSGSAIGCPVGGTTTPCAGNLKCADATTCRSNCSVNGDLDCTNSTWCNPSGNTCDPRIIEGSSCTRWLQCQSTLCDGGICRPTPLGYYDAIVAHDSGSSSNYLGTPIYDGTTHQNCYYFADRPNACLAAGVGDSCTGPINGYWACHCSSNSVCKSVRSPLCFTDSIGSFCGCRQVNGTILGCGSYEQCNTSDGTCKIRDGFPCTMNTECSSGKCNSLYCVP